MERGDLGVVGQRSTIFVFEDLIAHLERKRYERTCRRAGAWRAALNAWAFDYQVCTHLRALIGYEVPVVVVTWREPSFAELLHDHLWGLEVHVSETRSAVYSVLSPLVAVDSSISTVYDADPDHRFGYGYKGREFMLGQLF